MRPCAPDVRSRRLRQFVIFLLILIIASYSFLSYWEYSKEFYTNPAGWSNLLQGNSAAPAQYRIGVVFVAGFISKLSNGHLAIRHGLTLLDLIFLTVGVFTTFLLIARMRFCMAASHSARCITYLLAILLLLFYLSWTFWYHKPETIANFCSLAVASALMSGRFRIPTPLAMIGLILISAYLGTIRADAGFALNLGILLIAILLGGRVLPLGRVTQILTSIIGLGAVIGVESYIKYVLYPHNPFSDSLIQLGTNLKSPIALFCVVFALAPYFLIVTLARKHWTQLEAWECALVLASVIEFLLFFVVAKVDEVRLFLPFAMALLPTSAILLCRELIDEKSESSGPLSA